MPTPSMLGRGGADEITTVVPAQSANPNTNSPKRRIAHVLTSEANGEERETSAVALTALTQKAQTKQRSTSVGASVAHTARNANSTGVAMEDVVAVSAAFTPRKTRSKRQATDVAAAAAATATEDGVATAVPRDKSKQRTTNVAAATATEGSVVIGVHKGKSKQRATRATAATEDDVATAVPRGKAKQRAPRHVATADLKGKSKQRARDVAAAAAAAAAATEGGVCTAVPRGKAKQRTPRAAAATEDGVATAVPKGKSKQRVTRAAAAAATESGVATMDSKGKSKQRATRAAAAAETVDGVAVSVVPATQKTKSKRRGKRAAAAVATVARKTQKTKSKRRTKLQKATHGGVAVSYVPIIQNPMRRTVCGSTPSEERTVGLTHPLPMSNLELLERADALIGSDSDESNQSDCEEAEGSDVDEMDPMNDMQRAEVRDNVMATTADVNVHHDEDARLYTRLESDGPSDEDYDSGESEDWPTLSVLDMQAQLEDLDCMDDSSINEDDALLKLAKNRDEIKAWETSGWAKVPGTTERSPEYHGLYDGEWGPSDEVLKIADSPIDLFWFFFTKQLVHKIAEESNRYAAQTVIARARRIRDRQRRCKNRGSRSADVEPLSQIRERLRRMESFKPHEYAVVFGLLIARMLCPHKRRLSSHWSTTRTGAIPSGTFGAWMPRNRFDEIMQHLHFSDNTDPLAENDRAWKIRPVVDTLQQTFQKGYIPGPILSFDEGMLPSHSKFNGTRMYMKDKPHKWGTKLFMTCCPRTSYCMRLEVYCGKKAHLGGKQTIDDKSGPAAVLRNLDKVLPPERQDHRIVVIDRFYTSVALALELLSNKIYTVGTIQTRRIGFPSELKEKRKKRPDDIVRGSYALARSKAVPEMIACCWWDSKPVHFLATGASVQQLTTVRNTWMAGESMDIPCPKLVKDYHDNMNGVDVHDQLRLQRFSVQEAFKFKKYYKSLFLGLLDLVLVNAYIVHREYHKRRGTRGLSHSEFLTALHADLLATQPGDMLETAQQYQAPLPIPGRPVRRTANISAHEPTETNDFQGELGDPNRKRMHRACKVCSLLAPQGKRGKNTKWYCQACSEGHAGDVYLCQMVRHESFGEKKSCYAIWHEHWDCGKSIPQNLDKKLQFRKPTGKRRSATQSSPAS